MPGRDWNRDAAHLRSEIERSIRHFANEVRRDVVRPVCRQHGLKFVSGMGTWFFKLEDKDNLFTFHSKEDVNQFIQRASNLADENPEWQPRLHTYRAMAWDLVEALKVCSIVVNEGLPSDTIGYFVMDVR